MTIPSRRRSDNRRPSAWLVAPLLLVLTGCGSTALRGGAAAPAFSADGTTSTGQAGPADDGMSLPSADPGVSQGSGPRTGSFGGPGVAGQVPSASSGSAGAEIGSSNGLPSRGPLVSSKEPIKVGFAVTDAGALGAIFGVKHVDPTTGPKSMIAGLNKAGGIGGHQIVPVFFTADSSADGATVGQQACTAFTQDNKVDIVVGGVVGDTLPACLKQKGIAYFDPGTVATDPQQATRLPNWFQPSALRLDRAVRGTLQVGAQRGILKAGSKLGVLVEDCPAYRSIVTSTVLPMTQKLGVKVTQGSFRCVTNLVADLAPVTSDLQRETLRFSTAGVGSVVIVSPTEAFALANMTKNASQQKFFPKYLVSSNANVYGNSQSDAIIAISPDALPNIVGAGHLPLIDVGNQARPATSAQLAEQQRCTKLDPTQGGAASATGSGRYFQLNGFYAYCEALLVMKGSLEADGLRFGYADVAQGFSKALSSQPASAVLAGGRYGGGGVGRRDGAGYVQTFLYDAARKGFAYIGKPVQVS
jgi:hypothetical protein